MPSGGEPCPSGSQYSKQEKETCEAGKDLVKVVWFAEAVERLHQNSPRMGFSLGGSSTNQGGGKRRGGMGAGDLSHLIAHVHATDQGGGVSTLSGLTLSKKRFCRQRREMFRFDSASP